MVLTQQTVVFKGREFTIEQHADENSLKSPYTLHGKRGAKYILVRNANNPHRLFVVALKRDGSWTNIEGWLADDGGILREI